jgi:hypothetical protein
MPPHRIAKNGTCTFGLLCGEPGGLQGFAGGSGCKQRKPEHEMSSGYMLREPMQTASIKYRRLEFGVHLPLFDVFQCARGGALVQQVEPNRTNASRNNLARSNAVSKRPQHAGISDSATADDSLLFVGLGEAHAAVLHVKHREEFPAKDSKATTK